MFLNIFILMSFVGPLFFFFLNIRSVIMFNFKGQSAKEYIKADKTHFPRAQYQAQIRLGGQPP